MGSVSVWFSFQRLQMAVPIARRRTPFSRPNKGIEITRTRACMGMAENLWLLEAAKHTVDTYIKNGMVVGLGSGHASKLAIQHLGQKLRAKKLKDIVGVPMSMSSASEAAEVGIPLDKYQDSSQIDFAFHDANIMEEGSLVAVIGHQRPQGGDSFIQEKSIIKAAKSIVYIIEGKQYKGSFEGSIPVLVHTYNWMETAEEIDDLFLGDAEVWRRPFVGHAGPSGGDFPLVTREGFNVLDVIFTSSIPDLAAVAESLDKINGVVDHGVVCGIQCRAVVVSEGGFRTIDNLPKDVVSDI
ncbi:Ribose 5-phosphate isomerase, type A [Dillenia turbinata]|uniref:ribose-5-phosphate isomerase n=1 Tax=Dillenia turbinata TaxID=194707 RepID=A0AAN8UK07_9MAGN